MQLFYIEDGKVFEELFQSIAQLREKKDLERSPSLLQIVASVCAHMWPTVDQLFGELSSKFPKNCDRRKM